MSSHITFFLFSGGIIEVCLLALVRDAVDVRWRNVSNELGRASKEQKKLELRVNAYGGVSYK